MRMYECIWVCKSVYENVCGLGITNQNSCFQLTAFYPQWPIFCHPKKYEVRTKQDADFCDKAFDSKKGFAFGVFSVGCSCPCPANITYGFELMLSHESAHNLFRLLMCRNLDIESLEGVIFDFACGLDPYLLNRWNIYLQLNKILIELINFVVLFILESQENLNFSVHL